MTPIRSRALLLFVSALLAACVSRSPDPDLGIPVEPGAFFYDVTGNSEEELRASLTQERAIAVPSGSFDGYSRWRLRWRWRFDDTQDNCSLSEFSTTLIVQIFLPRWSIPENADADLVAKWSKYFLALVGHEGGHVEIAQEAELAVQRAVQRIPSARTCSELEGGINIAIQEAIEAFNHLSRAYDAASKHGAAQGARFP